MGRFGFVHEKKGRHATRPRGKEEGQLQKGGTSFQSTHLKIGLREKIGEGDRLAMYPREGNAELRGSQKKKE